jgi:hypothetical protein
VGVHIDDSGVLASTSSRPPGRSHPAASGTPAVGQRRPLGVGLHQRERQAVLALQGPGDPQLPGGQVDPDRAGAEAGQPGRHIAGAAAELQHVEAGDVVGQQPQLRLGDAPVAPYRSRLGPSPAAVGELVAVGSDVRRETFPERPVRGQILLGDCHPDIRRQNRHAGQPDRTVSQLLGATARRVRPDHRGRVPLGEHLSRLEQHDAGGEQERAVRTLQLAAETGVTIFRVGFEKWIARSAGTLARCIQETLDELKTLTTGV